MRETPEKTRANVKKALVLQGGGALGAYQAGVYAGLSETGYAPDWVAGISIGAINAALIAGNPPEKRVEKLRAFWERVSSGRQIPPLFFGDAGRALYNEMSAANVAAFGIEGFFKPRFGTGMFNPLFSSSVCDAAIYDTSPLRKTLSELADFDRINHGGVRLSVGAVNVRTGNFTYFDSKKIKIKPEHIMASGALPPGFPPIEIDGEQYWDGALVSNTPLQYVVDTNRESEDPQDMCVFQVDLFSARGETPKNIIEVIEREKDIRFSSRTRLNTDVFKKEQAVRNVIQRLLKKYPDQLQAEEDYELLKEWSCDSAITIIHLIYRQRSFETHRKDYEFSRLSMDEHWETGEADVCFALKQKERIKPGRPEHGVRIFDFNRQESE